MVWLQAILLGSVGFTPSATLTLSDLERLINDRSPEMYESRRAVRAAEAQLEKSRLLENPLLGLGVGTIPLGMTNPEGLNGPTQVMSYGGSLSYHFEILKRGRRQARERALLTGEEARRRREARLNALRLARVLGLLAATQMRVDSISQLIADSHIGLRFAEERAKSGFAASLEADRMQIEVYRLEQQLREAEIEQNSLIANCSEHLSQPCAQFSTTGDARSFIDGWLTRFADSDPTSVERRGDLRLLNALEIASRRGADLARAERVPDFTLSLGYLHDRFTISGNQLNSLALSLSIPLPLFDFGQAEEGLRDMHAQSYADERSVRARVADNRIDVLRRGLALQTERRQALHTKILPAARTVVADLERSFAQRLISQIDVLSARRALNELLLAQAQSYSDSFSTLVELIAELPEE